MIRQIANLPTSAQLVNEAHRMALEHVLWAAGEHLTPRDTLAGLPVQIAPGAVLEWHDAMIAIAGAWMDLREAERRAA